MKYNGLELTDPIAIRLAEMVGELDAENDALKKAVSQLAARIGLANGLRELAYPPVAPTPPAGEVLAVERDEAGRITSIRKTLAQPNSARYELRSTSALDHGD